MSREYNSAGRTLIVDEVIEVGTTFNSKTANLQQIVEKSVMRRNYSNIAKSISEISSDNWVTPQEKATLFRELNSIRSSYSSLSKQAGECGFDKVESDSYHKYTLFVSAFDNLNLLIGPLVSETENGEIVDGKLLSSVFIAYYQASASLEDEVFYVLNKQQKSLSLVLSATSFSYDAYGNLKPLVDSQGSSYEQAITVYTSQNGLDEAIVLTVNGDIVEHSFGEYTIHPDAMEGRTFIYVKALCGDLVRSNIITKVNDGGDSISVQVLSLNGNQFRAGTLSTTLIASVWRGSTDITDSLDDSAFSWRRTSNDPIADEAWNTLSKANWHKEIHLTPEDAYGRAVFRCEVDV